MTVGTQRLTVGPCLGDSVNGLVTVKTQELGDNRGTGDLDEDDVIEADAVEGIEEGKAPLDFVSLDHAREDVMHGELLTLTGEMIGDGEDGTQVVGWVTPFCGEEAVVEVEPSDHCSNVERAPDGVELVVSSGDTSALITGKRTASVSSDHKKTARRRTVWYGGPLDDRSEEFCALGESQTLETTSNGIDKTEPGGLVRELGGNLVVEDVVSDVLNDLIWSRTNGRFGVSGHVPGVCGQVEGGE